MNGLEIANKRIKEKEELTSKIYFWLMLIMLMTGIAVIIFLLWTYDMLNDLAYVLRVFL
jgi:hypothetical protein